MFDATCDDNQRRWHAYTMSAVCLGLLAVAWIDGFGPTALLAADDPTPVAERPVTIVELPGGIRAGVYGEKPAKPTPTLFVFAGDIKTALGNAYFRQCGNQLAAEGWLLVTLDLPSHGKDLPGGGLQGWANRIAMGEDPITKFTKTLSKALDGFIAEGYTDPDRVGACGTSRGGFIALQFAAHEPRVKFVAAFAPVTNLLALREFGKIAGDANVVADSLGTRHLAEKLAGRPVWLTIGGQDERVGTQNAVDFAEAVHSAAEKADKTDAIVLIVRPDSLGHTTPKGAPDQAFEWFTELKLP